MEGRRGYTRPSVQYFASVVLLSSASLPRAESLISNCRFVSLPVLVICIEKNQRDTKSNITRSASHGRYLRKRTQSWEPPADRCAGLILFRFSCGFCLPGPAILGWWIIVGRLVCGYCIRAPLASNPPPTKVFTTGQWQEQAGTTNLDA